MGNDYDEGWSNFTVRMRDDQLEKFTERYESKSGSARRIIDTWMEVEEEHGIHDDLEEMELAVLKTYLNAIEKNIVVMKNQRDKLQKRIDEMEEDTDGEVLVEVDLRMKQWNL